MTLHVDIRGEGPDLVLLHGWALHGGMWGPWLDELAGIARLHVFDLPGHGRSGGAPLRTVEELADWLIAALDAAGTGQAAIAGHSHVAPGRKTDAGPHFDWAAVAARHADLALPAEITA